MISITALCTSSRLAEQLLERLTERASGIRRPTSFQSTLTWGWGEHDPKGPGATIALDRQPPDAPLQLQLNGLLRHQLIHKAAMLSHQISYGIPERLRLYTGQLRSPAFATHQNRKLTSTGIPGQSPTQAFSLDQRRLAEPSETNKFQPGNKSG